MDQKATAALGKPAAKGCLSSLTSAPRVLEVFTGQDAEIGMRGLAVPVRDVSGRVDAAAAGLAGPIQRLTKKGVARAGARRRRHGRRGVLANGLARATNALAGHQIGVAGTTWRAPFDAGH
jgi:hypothetical protein